MTSALSDALLSLLREAVLWAKIQTASNLVFGVPLLIQVSLTLSLMREIKGSIDRHAAGLHYLDSLPGIFTRLFDRLNDLERYLWRLLSPAPRRDPHDP